MPKPLASHQVFKSDDIDQARQIVARQFCPHKLQRMSRSDQFRACHHRLMGKMLSVNYVDYGADVEIEPGELGSFYLLQIPLTGNAQVHHGNTIVESNPRNASLLNPTRHTRMRWHAGCSQRIVQIDRAALQNYSERWLDQSAADSIVFDPLINLEQPRNRLFLQKLEELFVKAEMASSHENFCTPDTLLLEHQFIDALLQQQPNSMQHCFRQKAKHHVEPGILKRVQRFVRENIDKPISLDELAKSANTSSRNLQLTWQNQFGSSPMHWLKQQRLNHARCKLLSIKKKATVRQTAQRAGFRHMGRFSSAYSERFGESPSKTKPLC